MNKKEIEVIKSLLYTALIILFILIVLYGYKTLFDPLRELIENVFEQAT